MKVEAILTEADIALEFTEALEARDIPEKFFFWLPNSAAAWKDLADDETIYGGLRATWKKLAAGAPALAKLLGSKLPVISFGAGDGSRDLMLVTALKAAGVECPYFPVDSSQALLEMACGAAEDADVEAVGIKADISSPVHLVYAADAADPPRILILSGNTMGVFDPLAQIRYVTHCMKPGDMLIVDGEIFGEDVSLERRSSLSAQKLLWALLGAIGIRQEDGELRFNVKRDDRHEGLHLITRHFRAERDISAAAAGHEVALQRGERIGLNFQYAYEPETFRWLLREQGGLQIQAEHISPDGRFLTALCAK
jgi:uncharacterized SAM-dependent methyltransferase